MNSPEMSDMSDGPTGGGSPLSEKSEEPTYLYGSRRPSRSPNTAVCRTASDMSDNGSTALSDQLERLKLWCDRCPPHARAQVAARLDALAVLLGQLVADVEDDQ